MKKKLILAMIGYIAGVVCLVLCREAIEAHVEQND